MERFIVDRRFLERRFLERGRVGLMRTATVLGRRVLGGAIGVALLAGVACGATRPDSSGADRAKADPSVLRAADAHSSSLIPIIVRESNPPSDTAERLVKGLGGTVTRDLSIIGAFSARLPADELPSLLASPDVLKVWSDGHLRATGTEEYNKGQPNRVWQRAINLASANRTADGTGVNVAVVDTGVFPVADLTGRIVVAADFTSEGDGLDRYGHGTHMAGIIAGNGATSKGNWSGVAPKAGIVSVKVAGADGSTDVSVVIAAMQWAVANRAKFNIKVLNLSYGTDSKQRYDIDPLNYAVEQAWFSGMLVVVAAGNRGPQGNTMSKPGDDPFVVAVGAADLQGTYDRSDDLVADFSSRGMKGGIEKPDLVAPGITIVSNRVVGSTVDVAYPYAAIDPYYMKGTGTSQATAIISGVAALMYQARPSMSPDVAKASLLRSAGDATASQNGGGAGLVNAAAAVKAAVDGTYVNSPANVGLTPSTGLGSLEASRGSYHVMVDQNGDGVAELLQGEFGFGWTAGSWSAGSWSGASWTAGSWSAGSWSAGSWSAGSWSAGSWSAGSWSAGSWSAGSWSASSWSAGSWSASSWSSDAWS
ncbi:MAG TPA: S8 family peptidase [Actinomycetota bacterium]